MTSDAQRRANAAHAQRLRASGWRKVTLWLSPDSLARLEALSGVHGSLTAVIEHLLGGRK